MIRRAYVWLHHYLRTGVPIETVLRSMSFATLLTLVAGVVASRSFIEDDAAEKAVVLAGYAEAKKVETHYLLPNRFGCKTLDAIAFLVDAKKTKEAETERKTVCCGAWFSGCAVRETMM